jgi:hypothetical protein
MTLAAAAFMNRWCTSRKRGHVVSEHARHRRRCARIPRREARIEFIRQYAHDSGKRVDVLRRTEERWWEETTRFFDVERTRAWVMVRRLTHTSHHRGQQMAMLRMLRRDLHSNYGPTADTGGLMQNHAPTIYAYPGVQALLERESHGGAKTPLPGLGAMAVTERPG